MARHTCCLDLSAMSSSETNGGIVYRANKKLKEDSQKIHTPCNQLDTSITLPKQSTSIQGQLPCEGRNVQVDFPVTPRHTNGKKRSHSTLTPPSSFTTTESLPTLAIPGSSTFCHASTQPSHPHQHTLTSSQKIRPHSKLEHKDIMCESDIISVYEEYEGDNTQCSSSDEDEVNENYETPVNENHETPVTLSKVYSFSWSEGSDFVPDQHNFQPNSSGKVMV
ncbi:hypothetical protein Pmani_016491 [Petrolisthes manimaculis]|uniref:Uncharacterized protein n=1 Tax=Petrolisthes manimaculis TaxID=1843537 RepID=A0AAE1U6N2_9EUCA|nr:hypothetical protein Pmani_016491 [Petrolisthes manimaculis]